MNNQTYEFCPKCGALMKEGLCTGCGMHMPEESQVQKPEGIAGQIPEPGQIPESGQMPESGQIPESGQGVYSSRYNPKFQPEDAAGELQDTYEAQNVSQGLQQNGQPKSQSPLSGQNGNQNGYGPQSGNQGGCGPQSGNQGGYGLQNQARNIPPQNPVQNQNPPPPMHPGGYGQQQGYILQGPPPNAYGWQNAGLGYNQNVYGNPPPGGQPPYWQGYPPYPPRQKPPMKAGMKALIVIAIVFLSLYVIFNMLLVWFIVKESSTTIGEEIYGGQGYEGGSGNYGNDIYGDIYGDGGEESQGQAEDEVYTPSPEDMYYYGPCDAINENVPYSFTWGNYSNQDQENEVDVLISYVQIEGENIPNLEKLNEAIKNVSLYYAEDFPKETYFAEFGSSYQVYITPYITYNDEDIVSIVLDEYIAMDDIFHVDLYAINIDIKNGVILENNSILDIDTAFAEEFRERCEEQNGEVEDVSLMTDEQLKNCLTQKDTAIAYYTPLGMEVGYNYNGEESTGWVTVTYKDYKNYIKKF